jgi:hypothetical protein
VQLTLQNQLDDRHTQAAEPGLGFGSAITKGSKPLEHDQVVNQAIRPIGTVPLPWNVVYQFGRMLWLGIVVTFGRRQQHADKRLVNQAPTTGADSQSHRELALPWISSISGSTCRQSGPK